MSSKMGKIYNLLYNLLCLNKYKRPNIFHFQFLSAYELDRKIKELSDYIYGNILDIGCGDKPYKNFFNKSLSYTGADILKKNNVDILIKKNMAIPVNNNNFDSIISTQVIEHIKDISFLNEFNRVLKNNGKFLITVPFLFPEHSNNDYRRFTCSGIIRLFETKNLYTQKSFKIGGFGSVTGLLILSWINCSFNKNKFTRILKFLLLPFFILLSLIINIMGLFFDIIDKTGLFYYASIIIGEKNEK